MILLHNCANNAEASVILHTLKEGGVAAIKQEAGFSGLFPIPGFGPSIYVQKKDIEKAQLIFRELEIEAQQTADNESFKDVDHEEIAYLKKIKEKPRKDYVYLFVVAFIIFIIMKFLVSGLF